MATPCNHEPMSEDSETDSGMETAENGEILPLTEEQKAIEAEKRKEAGNEQYKMKNYGAALNFYTEAIEICPTCAAYYGNRAATYMMLSKYAEALEDARMSVQLDPTFTKGYLREAKCHSAMGNTAASIHMYEKVLQNEPNNKTAKNELTIAQALAHSESSAAKEIEKGDFRKAVWYLNKCIDQAPTCQKYKILKAEGLVLLKRYDEALEITVDILQLDSMNADALYVRGLCLYYQDNIEKAYQHFQKVLRLAPDHTKARNAFRKAKLLQAKKEEGNTAFRSGRLEEAYNLYTDALNIDPHNIFVNSKIYCNRATVLSKLKKTDEAISDCSQAIKLDDTYLKAYMRRARCYMDTEQYEEAVRDYEKIYQMDRTRNNKEMLQNAKLELKKSKRKDYYKILGVSKTAGEDEIKKAYKKRALLHHPDRHAHATDEVKKEEEKKFKEIGEAYTVLSDQKKKMRYDSGQDLDDMDGGFSDIDPNSIFQAFFGGPGGFSYGGGPGMGGNFGGASGGFPGGFTFQFG